MKKLFLRLWTWLTFPVVLIRTRKAMKGISEYYGRAAWEPKKYCKVAYRWSKNRQKRA